MNARFEVGLVADGFFGIVPRQQKSEALGTEVKAVGHVDDHWDFVRDAVEGLGRDQLAPERFDGEIDTGECGDLRSPGSGGVDHDAGAYGAASGFDASDPGGVAMDRSDFGGAPDVWLRARLRKS